MIGMEIAFPNEKSASEMRIDLDPSIALLQLFLLAFMFYWLFFCDKKISASDYLVGCLFSAIFTLTRLFYAGQPYNIDLSAIYTGGILNELLNFFSFIGWAICFSVIFSYLRNHFGSLILDDNIPSFLLLWLMIILIWFLTVFLLLPGQISWDAWRQFCEFDVTKVISLHFTYIATNHQPWITTLIFGFLFSLGRKMAGVNFGVFTVIFVQFLISSLIYTDVVRFVWHKAGKVAGIISLVIFASPIFSTYAVTVDKSTLYYAFAAWFYVSFVEIFDNLKRGERQSLRKKILPFILSGILFDFFRNDSFVIVLAISLILLGFSLYFKSSTKYILFAFLAIFMVHFSWQGYLSNQQIVGSAPSEALTIPTRQLSYVVLRHRNYLSSSELDTINKITPLKQIHNNYSISNGDNLKNLYPSNTFLNNPQTIREVVNKKKTVKTTPAESKKLRNYLKVWLKVGIRHPMSYIKIYLAANATYLNPFLQYNSSLFLNYYPNQPTFLHPSWYKDYHPLFSVKVRNAVRQLITFIVSLPPLAFVLNAGSAIWLSVLLFCLVLSYLHDKKIAWLLIPQLLMCSLVTVVSVSGYSRYTIGILATLPITISYCLNQAHLQRVVKNNG